MSELKKIAIKQCRNKVKSVHKRFKGIVWPNEGWIKTLRQALNMSGAQLARRLGVTRGLISKTEKAELCGGVTLKKMQEIAQGMNCRFVYAIVPETDIEDLLKTQAIKKASSRVKRASIHMALEDQALNGEQLRLEIERLAENMLTSSDTTLWDED
jgi:predicted DNA-binding mobile mystery protein A